MKSCSLLLSSSFAELQKVVARLCSERPDFSIEKESLAERSFSQIIGLIHSPDLFSNRRIMIVDKVELLKKADLQLLNQLLESGLSGVYLILSGSALSGSLDKKWVDIYDFTAEKPWERLARIKQWLVQEARSFGKELSQELLAFLIDEVSQDFALLQQELAKLVCYVGERPRIERKDAQALILSRKEFTGWHLAEQLVWGEGGNVNHPAFDISFIPQVRYHLQLGYKIASLLERKYTSQEILDKIPALKPNMMHKYGDKAERLGSAFFSRGLEALLECEIACKNSGLSPSLYWMQFYGSLSFT